jgi:hypothetical protein
VVIRVIEADALPKYKMKIPVLKNKLTVALEVIIGKWM